jgi:hypothetical protein
MSAEIRVLEGDGCGALSPPPQLKRQCSEEAKGKRGGEIPRTAQTSFGEITYPAGIEELYVSSPSPPPPPRASTKKERKKGRGLLRAVQAVAAQWRAETPSPPLPRTPDEDLLKDLDFNTVLRIACRSIHLTGTGAVFSPVAMWGKDTQWMLEFDEFLDVEGATEFCAIAGEETEETKETKSP